MRYVEVLQLYLMRTLTNLEFYILVLQQKKHPQNGFSVLRVQIYDVFVGRFVYPM